MASSERRSTTHPKTNPIETEGPKSKSAEQECWQKDGSWINGKCKLIGEGSVSGEIIRYHVSSNDYFDLDEDGVGASIINESNTVAFYEEYPVEMPSVHIGFSSGHMGISFGNGFRT